MDTLKDKPALAGGSPIRRHEQAIVFGSPAIGEAEIQAMADCVNRRWIGTGPKVAEFESAFASYKGSPHAIAVSSCSAAIHLALMALGVGPGDEVISPTLTYCAAIHNILHVGATPVLVDSDSKTLNLVATLDDVVTSRTKAIIVMHFAGRCCEMDKIMDFARARGIFVIEDCAHAIEARFQGESAGMIGDIGCFSFYPTKNMTTIEGGMVITRDNTIAAKVRSLSRQGVSHDTWSRFRQKGYHHYDIIDIGYKYNMTDIQAAIGLVQLDKINERLEQRQLLWSCYEEGLQNLSCIQPEVVLESTDTIHARHLYTIQIELEHLSIDREQFMEALWAEHIGVGVHYVPIHLSSYYQQRFSWKEGDFPNAERAGERLISLPLGANLVKGDIDDVCRIIERIYNFYRK